jgi:hypothetical protein
LSVCDAGTPDGHGRESHHTLYCGSVGEPGPTLSVSGTVNSSSCQVLASPNAPEMCADPDTQSAAAFLQKFQSLRMQLPHTLLIPCRRAWTGTRRVSTAICSITSWTELDTESEGQAKADPLLLQSAALRSHLFAIFPWGAYSTRTAHGSYFDFYLGNRSRNSTIVQLLSSAPNTCSLFVGVRPKMINLFSFRFVYITLI